MTAVKGMTGSVEPYFDELKYYNHGDNPVYKKMMKIGQENLRGGKMVDHRTFVLDRGIRLAMARNLDDVFQRDLKADTFPKAFAIWVLFGMVFTYTHKASRRLIPVGRFGIRKINETQFFQNFGWLGVAGAAAWYGTAATVFYKSTKFMVHKFYRHVIQQNRSWIAESVDVSNYGDYQYPECQLIEEDEFQASPGFKLMGSLPPHELSYFGPYTKVDRAGEAA